MAFKPGSKKPAGKSAFGKSKPKTKSSEDAIWRTVGAVWQNGDYINFSANNLDFNEPVQEYKKGRLLWQDDETGQVYLVQQFGLKEAQKGPIFNASINLSNEFHVKPIED